jgi:hypothetical protein
VSKLAMLFGITVALLIYGGVNLYVGHHLYGGIAPLFPSVSANLPVFACLYGFLALILLFPFFPLPRKLHKWATWIGSYWMGLFVYLFLGFAAADALLLAGVIVQIVPWPVPADIRMWAWLLAVIAAAGLSAYGILHARRIRVVRYDIGLRNSGLRDTGLKDSGLKDSEARRNQAGRGNPEMPERSDATAQASLQGKPSMKIVVISDLHLGAVHSEGRLEKVAGKILALKPDLVLIPGDIFNDDFRRIQDPERVKRLFRQLCEQAPFGVYASLGNHDGGRTFPQMVEFLRDCGIGLLMEESVVVDGPTGRFVLVGRLDPSPIGGYGGLRRKPTRELLAEVAELASGGPGGPRMPVIVMDHTPRHLEQYGREVDLIVSGHTHKGQLFPNNLITRRMYVIDYGYYRKDPDSPHVIVTSGAGTWGMPMRVGSDCEIVEIALV